MYDKSSIFGNQMNSMVGRNLTRLVEGDLISLIACCLQL